MRHVLFVDSQPDLRAVVQQALVVSGDYRVSCAASADEALPVLDHDRPDLVALDAVIPDIPGVELATHTMQRGIPIIVTTAEPDMDVRLLRLGWPRLRKPFSLEFLLAECGNAIAETQRNLSLVRTSLQRLAKSFSDVKDVVATLRALRERVGVTLAASRRLH